MEKTSIWTLAFQTLHYVDADIKTWARCFQSTSNEHRLKLETHRDNPKRDD